MVKNNVPITNQNEMAVWLSSVALFVRDHLLSSGSFARARCNK